MIEAQLLEQKVQLLTAVETYFCFIKTCRRYDQMELSSFLTSTLSSKVSPSPLNLAFILLNFPLLNHTSVRELGNVSLQCPKLTKTNYTTWPLMMETILKAYGIWETIVTKEGIATNEKKENTSKAIIFQSLPEDVLMQVAQYSTAKEILEPKEIGQGAKRKRASSGGYGAGSSRRKRHLITADPSEEDVSATDAEKDASKSPPLVVEQTKPTEDVVEEPAQKSAEAEPKALEQLIRELELAAAHQATLIAQSDVELRRINNDAFNLLKERFKSALELEYHLENIERAMSNDMDWLNPEGHKDIYNDSETPSPDGEKCNHEYNFDVAKEEHQCFPFEDLKDSGITQLRDVLPHPMGRVFLDTSQS
ncbi:zinc finger, CCHC-type [Artemisia annua]|uniref:Zinc finger, CCHC-type n=1 Tax=Artemisia annua TaxID=35608 RepID=A0A2U1NK04_ARTAN|nr:zinc finger, CCHC-type [Artemisia annua]